MVGVTLIKKFNYRGNALEEFSNQYWLTGGTPSGPTDWVALADALIAAEKTCYPSGVVNIRQYGHTSNAPGAAAVWSRDLAALGTTVAGTLAPSGTWTQAPGDAAVWVRWRTSRLTSPGGKPIYLRKYFHGATIQTTASPDTVTTSQVTALNALGAKLDDGSFLDARKITAPGVVDVITSHSASAFLTTRTLKRRGKRPGS